MLQGTFIFWVSNVHVLAMVGHLKNVCSTFAQMPNRITNDEFITFSPTIANTMLAAVYLCSSLIINGLKFVLVS